MNYSASTADVPQGSSFSPGINENVNLASFGAEETPTGFKYLNFTFEKGGSEFSLKFWDIDEQKIKDFAESQSREHTRDFPQWGYVKGTTITPQQAVDIAVRDYMRKILSILMAVSGFSGEIKATSKEDFVTKVNEILKVKNPVRLLIVYNKKDYYDIPRFGTFVQSMSVPNTIKIGDKEKLTKSVSTVEQPTMEGSNSTDDLPF